MSEPSSFEIEFPEYLNGYESETESKGYLVDVIVRSGDREWRLAIYDVVRLQQEVADEVRSAGYSAMSNVLIVPQVTRRNILVALFELAKSDFQSSSSVLSG